MNTHLCAECRKGLGPIYRYLPEIIKSFRTEDKWLDSMKIRLLNFFGVDVTAYKIEERLTNLEKEIATIKNTELKTIFDQKEQIIKMEKELKDKVESK